MSRRGFSPRGARGGQRHHRRESRSGRLFRGALEFLLVVVLLLFTASWLGLLEPRRHSPGPATGESDLGETRVVPALVTESAPNAGRGHAALRGGDPRGRERVAPHADLGGDAGQEPAIRIYLANGSGVPKLAASLREPLRCAGFDVCGTANADCSDYGETVVVDRSGERWKADAVCRFLREHWGAGRVVLQARSSLESDVLVILGRDLGEAWARQGASAR